MRDFDKQPAPEDAVIAQSGEEQPIVQLKTDSTLSKPRWTYTWRFLVSGGIIVLVLVVIFASVLATSRQRQTQVPKTGSQPRPTASSPLPPSLALPVSTATPLPASGASSHSLSISLVNGVAYVGTMNNAVYALRMSNGTKLWQQQIAGSVGQQPLVVNGVVYVSTFVGQYGPGYIYALRASDGSILWRFTSNSSIYLPSSTDDKSTLYVVSQEGVTALQASDGQVRWRFATQGAGDSAPIVDNGVIYATSSLDSGPGILNALRASDGMLLWQHRQGYYISVDVIANHAVYITSNGMITTLYANNGKTLWQRAIDATIIGPLQLVNGIIYASGTKITYPPAAQAVPSTQGRTAMSTILRTFPVRPTKPLKGGVSTVYAMRADDGTMLWRYPLLDGKNSWSGWLFAQDGVIYTGAYAVTNTTAANQGEIYALHSESGAVIWRDTMQAVPENALLANGVIYLNANSNNASNITQSDILYALRADNGTLLWSYPINGIVYSAPLLVDAVLYVGADNGMLYALRTQDGKLLWHYQTDVGA